jgi:hypothetical protein
MIARHAASLVRAATVAGVLTAASIGAAATATAYPAGDIFLYNLKSHGIVFDLPEQAFEAANIVCSLIASGEPYETLIERGVSDSGLTEAQFGYLVEQSVQFSCPTSSSYLPA